MKIAIQPRENSHSSDWIAYCEKKEIPYKLVDCYRYDIIEQLEDCDALMWHYYHECAKDVQVAKQILFALEGSGKIVYPDFLSNWHFDDKVGQKYLLESIGAPMVPSYVFYSREEAVEWARNTSYPKVFKLRGGSASYNVKLVHTPKQAKHLISKAFGKGVERYHPWDNLKDRWRLYRLGLTNFYDCVKGLGRFFIPTYFCRVMGKDRGYAYFQDFIPDNVTDVRVLWVYDRCLAFHRVCRKGDFRASGSRQFDYDQDHVPRKAMELAFEVAHKLKLQSAAFDFVMQGDEPLLVELCWASGPSPEQNDHGYYDRDLNWHNETFNPNYWMVDWVVDEFKRRNGTSK